MNDDLYVYWEKQEKDIMTCGVHCLNALLQGPVFTEVQLSEIALRLDEQEKKLGVKSRYYAFLFNDI